MEDNSQVEIELYEEVREMNYSTPCIVADRRALTQMLPAVVFPRSHLHI